MAVYFDAASLGSNFQTRLLRKLAASNHLLPFDIDNYDVMVEGVWPENKIRFVRDAEAPFEGQWLNGSTLVYELQRKWRTVHARVSILHGGPASCVSPSQS